MPKPAAELTFEKALAELEAAQRQVRVLEGEVLKKLPADAGSGDDA
jgi:hypothetical protein